MFMCLRINQAGVYCALKLNRTSSYNSLDGRWFLILHSFIVTLSTTLNSSIEYSQAMVEKRKDHAFSVLPTSDLQADIAFYTRDLGMRLLSVYPANNPVIAELVGLGLSLRLDSYLRNDQPGMLLVKTEDKSEQVLHSPSGTTITWERVVNAVPQSLDSHRLEVCTLRGSSPWVVGRAGTHTRELIPSRLGGGIVASHIRIPNGGPVADRVHYHTTSFQLVYCVQGWIKIVYEDQGQAITLKAGDCVTQPPHIRHRVIETSNGLEVIEIGMPAEHISAIDNDMLLPNDRVDSHRLFDGQRFCHHRIASASWMPHRLPGFVSCETGTATASGNIAGARVLRAAPVSRAYKATHSADVLFSFVLAGSMRLDKQLLVAGDAFTVPPNDAFKVSDISKDATVLEVSIPGMFETQIQLVE